MIPTVSSCCFVFDLKTGCLAIGIVCIIIGVLFAAGNQVMDNDDKNNSQKMTGTASACLYIIVGLLIVIGILLNISILVVVGAVVLIVVWILNFVVAIVVFLDNGKAANLLIEFLLLILFVYFFICLWSYAGLAL